MSQKKLFYDRLEITDTAFPNKAQFIFPFTAGKVIIVNDTVGITVSFSISLPDLGGELFCGDGPIAFDGLGCDKIHCKVDSAVAQVRVWAWRL